MLAVGVSAFPRCQCFNPHPAQRPDAMWAAGITDTLAARVLCETMGYDVPIVAVPYLKQQLAKHPVFSKNVALLREWGVHILYEPERYPSPQIVPWSIILDTLNSVTGDKEQK